MIILGFLSDKEKKSLAEAQASIISKSIEGISIKEIRELLIEKRTEITFPEVKTILILVIS